MALEDISVGLLQELGFPKKAVEIRKQLAIANMLENRINRYERPLIRAALKEIKRQGKIAVVQDAFSEAFNSDRCVIIKGYPKGFDASVLCSYAKNALPSLYRRYTNARELYEQVKKMIEELYNFSAKKTPDF